MSSEEIRALREELIRNLVLGLEARLERLGLQRARLELGLGCLEKTMGVQTVSLL